jgi:hypothetical protein
MLHNIKLSVDQDTVFSMSQGGLSFGEAGKCVETWLYNPNELDTAEDPEVHTIESLATKLAPYAKGKTKAQALVIPHPKFTLNILDQVHKLEYVLMSNLDKKQKAKAQTLVDEGYLKVVTKGKRGASALEETHKGFWLYMFLDTVYEEDDDDEYL